MLMRIRWIQLLCFIAYIASGYTGRRKTRYSGTCPADLNEPWSYNPNLRNGPYFWGSRYPRCNGWEQSPVDIQTRSVIPVNTLKRLYFVNYDVGISGGTIRNNGKTIILIPNDGVERSITIGGDVYFLIEIHFHWGDASNKGSEHTVDGTPYSMEMHLVHKNSANGIAIVAVFFQETDFLDNAEIQNIIVHFPYVTYKGTRTQLQTEITLDNLLPSNPASFYRYRGSLTSPGCDEGVIWSVLTQSVLVGSYQMGEFRKLYSTRKQDATKYCKLSNNYRPTLLLNGRKVYASK